jgi:hypothetical protein
MKTLIVVTLCMILAAAAVLAGPIDGKWVAERKMERDGQSFTIIQTFALKSEGNKLTGTVSMQFGDMEPRSMEVKNGTIEGEKFSFTTEMSTPNGDFKMNYKGSVEGDSLKGTSEREGGEPRPFEAKKK